MEIKDLIKSKRLQLGLTLEELGNKVGVSKATVLRWESGEIQNMRREKIAKLAIALQTTPEYLMGWEEKEIDKVAVLPALSTDETTLLTGYRELTTQGKEYILQTLYMAEQTYKKDDTISKMDIG